MSAPKSMTVPDNGNEPGSRNESGPLAAGLCVVTRLGAQGDGIADQAVGHDGEPVYVPFGLPGETWAIQGGAIQGGAIQGGAISPEGGAIPRDGQTSDAGGNIVAAGRPIWPTGSASPLGRASPERVAPVCAHFGVCGGCVAQHMGQSLYATWKRDIVVEAFRQRGLSPDVAALVTVAAGSRRRATFTAGRTDGGLRFGYHARASHTLVDIARCPVLAPPIEAALPALKAICALLLAGRGGRGGGRSAARQLRVHVTLARGGLDVAMSRVDDAATVGRARTAPNRQAHQRKSATEPPHIDSGTRQAIAARAEAARILRLSLDGELVLAGPAPLIALSGVDVLLPEATFLQAVAEAEASMIRLVLDGVGAPRGTSRGRGRVADLFCGLGPFTFALARTRPVLAMDSDAAAIAALTAASRQAQGRKPIEARRRDLYQEPLAARELAGFDAVVLDPPRAGASAQVAALAESDVARVVMVSCNPATLARDVRTLVDGGYQLGTVTPIDQFVYAPHVEVVAVLTRPS